MRIQVVPLNLLDYGSTQDGMIPGLKKIGDMFSSGEIFLPEMLMATEAFQEVVNLIEPKLLTSSEKVNKTGTVVKANTFEKIDNDWFRIGNPSLYVDIVYTSTGTIRIGSMPDISKLTRKYNINEDIVIVPDWFFSQGGDNRTGEELNFWCYAAALKYPPLYLGHKSDIDALYKNLDMIFSYYFDSSMTRVIKKDWIDKFFRKYKLKDGEVYRKNGVEIRLENEKIIIIDKNKVKYNSSANFDKGDFFIEKTLSSLQRCKKSSNCRDCIEVIVVGNGNGFVGITSSFIVHLRDYLIWIDPCAQPAFSLGKIGIHWDDVTHLLITHNHEDHISGFTACLKRAVDKGKTVKIITAPNIYQILLKQFRLLFPDIEKYLDLIPLTPEKSCTLGNYKIEARWNHHIIPYGTLGLKISSKSNCWGFSGDTKYDEKIIKVLKRKELEPEWFENCDVLFHEVDFKSPKTVHTYYKELQKLETNFSGKLFVYHTDVKGLKKGFTIAEEGRRYLLNKGKLEIR